MTWWCRVSFWMVKVSCPARIDVRRSFDACSEQTVCYTTRGARSNGQSVMASAWAVVSVNGQLSHHLVVSGQLLDGQSFASRSPRRAVEALMRAPSRPSVHRRSAKGCPEQLSIRYGVGLGDRLSEWTAVP